MTPQIKITKLPLLPLALFKASPNRRVTVYKNGCATRTGQGLSGVMVTTNTNLTSVPTGTLSCPFSLNCNSLDRQKITLSGTAIFSIGKPELLGTTFDFTVGEKGHYESEDPSHTHDRLLEILSSTLLAAAARRSLSELLGPQDNLSLELLGNLTTTPTLEKMGIGVESLSITQISPAPEIEKALESIRAEELKKESDAAIQDRQVAAELKDRQLKQEQLITGKKVQEGEREILEAQYETEKRKSTLAKEVQKIELEKEKERIEHEAAQTQALAKSEALVAQTKAHSDAEVAVSKAKNETEVAQIRSQAVEEEAKHIIALGKAEGEALQARTSALEKLDAKKLQALALAGGKPGGTIAAAFLEMAERAGQIGTLNITPDLLQSLVAPKK
jgi:hypothetical protein